MSSTIRENSRSLGREASYNGLVRRMVSLPRTLFGGFSRAMNHSIDIMGIGGRSRNQNPFPSSHFRYSNESVTNVSEDQWAFLSHFQSQYGSFHPFFYACGFMEALKIAENDHKFLFVYLHSPEHPFAARFCKETLCSEIVVQFLDANFVCWGGLVNRGEGLQMNAILRPESYPFCAVIAPAPGDSITVLQQMEGPISPAELVEILQRTMEEQGLAFGGSRAKKEEKIRADRRLREEQDAAYLAALHIDKENEKIKSSLLREKVQKSAEVPNKEKYEKPKYNPTPKDHSKVKENTFTAEAPNKELASRGKASHQATQILIRFPNGEKREQSFSCTDKVKSIYRYIDSLGLPGISGNYKLISNFPRKVYDVDKMGMSLKEAGLHPRATLFLEHHS